MAYFGLQYRGTSISESAEGAWRVISAALSQEKGPGHWDRARYIDEEGFTNIISIGYWDALDSFDDWYAQHGANWASGALMSSAFGTFVEIVRPAIERFETLFSADVPEGVACLAEGLGGAVQEH